MTTARRASVALFSSIFLAYRGCLLAGLFLLRGFHGDFFSGFFGANVSFGGTSLIIVVGVVIETIKNIESRMLVRNYQGFLLD